MFQGLLNPSGYSYGILSAQISIKLLLLAYVGTSVVAILFGIFLWRRTQKLSSFYLLLISLCFGVYCFLDLTTWTSTPRIAISSWSVLDIFWMGFPFLSYWFLYSFIKDRDLPMWQKIVSVSILIPYILITIMSSHVNTFYTSDYSANESSIIVMSECLAEIFFILTIILFTFIEYRKATNTTEKKKIALAGLGVFAFLFMFNFWGIVSLLVQYFNFWGYGENAYSYIFEVYGMFGMPILLAFLGYLIMKYQAFDLKPIKSVMLVIVLMLILFISTFV